MSRIAAGSTDERVTLTFEEAEAMLADGDLVHTMRSAGNLVIGADWPRADLLAAMREAPSIQLAGPAATQMGHGLAVQVDGWLFVKTREPS